MKPPIDEDDVMKLEAYEAALKAMWVAQPNRLTQARYTAFTNNRRLNRLLWVNWVEANALKIDWCQELLATAISLKLGAE